MKKLARLLSVVALSLAGCTPKQDPKIIEAMQWYLDNRMLDNSDPEYTPLEHLPDSVYTLHAESFFNDYVPKTYTTPEKYTKVKSYYINLKEDYFMIVSYVYENRHYNTGELIIKGKSNMVLLYNDTTYVAVDIIAWGKPIKSCNPDDYALPPDTWGLSQKPAFGHGTAVCEHAEEIVNGTFDFDTYYGLN